MSPDTTGRLGSILGIWGHPDDEAYLTAGLMMRAIADGQRVTCVTATRGEAGFAADDPRSTEERMRVREAEIAACMAVLGVTDHRWLGYGDGRCADVPDDEAAKTLAAIIEEVRPDTVLTFGPDGGTGHPDHIAACRWTTRAMALVDLPDTRLLYSTKGLRWQDAFFAGIDTSTVMMVDDLEPERWNEDDLDVWFTCTGDLLERKVAALRAQASQVEPFIEMVGLERYTAFVAEEFFRAPLPADEAFIERARTFVSK